MASTVSQKDTTFTKIFVGGLPYHTTDQSLREFFEQFGDIEEAVVITDRQTGKSRGYGFVTMSDRAAAERACKDPNPVIDGRKANVNLAYLGAKPRALPFALKAGYPGFIQGGFGYPQYVLPSAYISSPGVTIPTVAAQSSPLSPTTAAAAAAAGQLFDYSAAAASFQGAQLANGFDTYPYTTAAAGFVTPTAYSTYPNVPQPLAQHFAHYQPQQIQERMN